MENIVELKNGSTVDLHEISSISGIRWYGSIAAIPPAFERVYFSISLKSGKTIEIGDSYRVCGFLFE